MKKSVRLILLITGLTIAGCLHNVAYAQKVSAQSGNFSDGTTWVGGSPPATYDYIVIASGHTVTLDVAPIVGNITIQPGATLDNGAFNLTIDRATTGNPIYTNNGTHNGTGYLVAYDDFKTELSGNGITNCTVIIRSYGLGLLNDCQLTINGNIQHASPGNFGMNNKILIDTQTGASLTINGDIITDPVFGGVGIENGATITVNGNVSLPGSSSSGSGGSITNFAAGTFNISGDLSLGPYYSYCANSGIMTVGGDLLGASVDETFFVQGVNSVVKFGGQIFPGSNPGYFDPLIDVNFATAEPNTVEFIGLSDQIIVVPGQGAYSNLIISNSNAKATANAAISINGDLTVKPGSALTVGASGSLAVAGAFIIESDATGTGSFISGSAITGNVERYVAGHNNIGNNAWHLLSSPVATQAISNFHTAGSGDDFYKWSDVEGLWINRTTAANGLNPDFETNFVSGRGYLVAYVNTDTKTFSGSINTSNASVSGLTTLNGGWHLLGNHFSSAIKWNDGNWALNNVDAVAQVWVAADASYTPIVANEYIPTMNGFFVRANQTNASLTIPAAARDHNSTNWYKAKENQDRIVLRAIDHEGQTAQITIIRTDGNANLGYDTEYDSYFLPGFAPQMYTCDQQGNKYAMNTLPAISDDLSIPVGFVKNQSNHFTIAMAEGYQGQSLYLSDQYTNQTVDLTQWSYSFSATENDLSRFTLHFALVGIDEMEAFVPSLHAWHANGVLYLNDAEPGLLNIFDTLGRPVFQQQLTGNGHLTLTLELKPGIYIVQLRTGNGAKTAKINIQ